MIYDKDQVIEENNFKKLNNYKKILNKGINALTIEEKLEDIERKIQKLSLKDLNRILNEIEDAISR